MSQFALFHIQTCPYLRVQNGNVEVMLRVSRELEVGDVFLRGEPDNEEVLTPMSLHSQKDSWCYYTAELIRNHAEPATLYSFKVLIEGRQLWLDAAGISRRAPLRERQFRYLFESVPPTWLNAQVFYQIFPERFCNGDPSISVSQGEYQVPGAGDVVQKNWGEPVDDNNKAVDFFGGDLIGVTQQLDYLQALGVTAIYLNPVFTSPSVHKYNTVDYYQVDPHFGGNPALAELCEQIHAREMRIVLDAVLNHTSDQHPWFDRYQPENEQGAYHHPDSPTRGYYSFMSDEAGADYVCWQGVDCLPVLDLSHPELLEYFFDADDAVVKHWMNPPYEIDGWRFDVIHMMGEGAGARNNAKVIEIARSAIKQHSPEALFLGEHFYEATRWLQGGLEDGAMNYYGFAVPLRAFFAGLDVHYQPNRIDAAEFDEWLTDARARVPYANQLVQWNLLDSHDTARFYTSVQEDMAVMKQAVAMLMIYPGIPSVYYGDEIGLTGDNDPHCRACFDWDKSNWEMPLWSWYQRLIALRKSSPALCEGAYQTLYAMGDLFIFARLHEQGSILVALNRGVEPLKVHINLADVGLAAKGWQEIVMHGTVSLESAGQLRLGSKSCAVWQGPGLS